MILYTVTWQEMPTNRAWEDFTEWVTATMGQPGARWHTVELDSEYMSLLLREPVDADLLLLRWGGRARPWSDTAQW